MTTSPKIEKRSPEQEALMRAQALARVESYEAGGNLPKDFQERVKRLRRNLMSCFACDAASILDATQIFCQRDPGVAAEAAKKGGSYGFLLWAGLAMGMFVAWLCGFDSWLVQLGVPGLTARITRSAVGFLIGFCVARSYSEMQQLCFAQRVEQAMLDFRNPVGGLPKTVALIESPEWHEYMQLVATMGSSSLLGPDHFSEDCVRRRLVELAKAKVQAEQAYDSGRVASAGLQFKEAFRIFRGVGILRGISTREVFAQANRELESDTATADRTSGKSQ